MAKKKSAAKKAPARKASKPKGKPVAKKAVKAKGRAPKPDEAARKGATKSPGKATAKAPLRKVGKTLAKKIVKVSAEKVGAPEAPAEDAAPAGIGVGDAVPPFTLPDQDGNPVSSGSLAGKPYVLYFYPKDDTPGCTREACGFRDDLGRFEALGTRVVGVSPDKPDSHVKFREKYGLNFPLLADTEKELANAFGVWVKKQNYGREYMGIQRSTFLVGADGRVKKAWRNVKVDGHVAAVLAEATR